MKAFDTNWVFIGQLFLFVWQKYQWRLITILYFFKRHAARRDIWYTAILSHSASTLQHLKSVLDSIRFENWLHRTGCFSIYFHWMWFEIRSLSVIGDRWFYQKILSADCVPKNIVYLENHKFCECTDILKGDIAFVMYATFPVSARHWFLFDQRYEKTINEFGQISRDIGSITMSQTLP